MALMPREGDIPKNAITLSRSEALKYQWQQIHTWPDKSDTWPFRWGITTLGAAAGASGWYINSRYRRKFKLRNYGYVVSTFPMLVSPALVAIATHLQFVTSDLFLGETKCPVCLQQKASLIQIGCAVVYPAIGASLFSMFLAAYFATCNVPYWNDYKGLSSLWWKSTKPLGKSFLVVACIQLVAANLMTYVEADNLYNLRTKLNAKSND